MIFKTDYLNEINSSAYHLNTTQIQVGNTPQSYVSTQPYWSSFQISPRFWDSSLWHLNCTDTNSFTFDDLSIGSRSSSPQTCQTQHGDQFSDEGITPRNIESIGSEYYVH